MKYKILAINLLYNPSGGSLAQIKKIFEHLNEFKFDYFVIYTTPSNLHLIEDLNSENVKVRCTNFGQINLISRTIWEQLILPIYLKLDGINILFCPGNIAPVFSSVKKAQWIGTIGPFDEVFVRLYAKYSSWKRLVLLFNKYLMLYSAKTSDHVFFESFYTRNLFLSKYGLNEKKTSVLQIGRDEYFEPDPKKENKKYSDLLKKRYILSVSHLYPYKNIEILIHAFGQLKDVVAEHNLILAGSTQNNKYFKELLSLVQYYGIQDQVFFVGNLEPSDLKQFYSNCDTLIFTSPFENFAYTLVEAMSCGAPIISTNTTAMPETCQNAAVYFDPYSVEDLLSQIELVLSSRKVRNELIKNSLARAGTMETYLAINIKTNEILQNVIK